MPEIEIPASLLPADPRFGAGPSRIRPAQLTALTQRWAPVLGTSHRQAPVLDLVRRVRHGLAQLFSLPDGYEVVLGNGGSTTFWDLATLALIENRSQHVSIGEFSAKFARCAAEAPFLREPGIVEAAPGAGALPWPEPGVDAYCWPHNETSTGVVLPVQRVPTDTDALMLVDATSAAGGVPVDVSQCDAYYFAPQKGFGSDGGLWLALLSPAAVERALRLRQANRWVPASLSLATAIESSRREQTHNTPALATLALLLEQVEWMLTGGGLAWAVGRSAACAAHVYGWAESRSWATPFVQDHALRSPVVATVDLDPGVDAGAVTATLRAHGVLDTEPYRGLGRNQLRIGMFPAVELSDVQALTACIDHVVDRLY